MARLRVTAGQAGAFFANAPVPASVHGGAGADDAVAAVRGAGASAVRIRLGAHTVERDPSQDDGPRSGRMLLFVQDGHAGVEAAEHGFRAVDGDVIVFDLSTRYRIVASADAAFLALSGPALMGSGASGLLGDPPRRLDRGRITTRAAEASARHLSRSIGLVHPADADAVISGILTQLRGALDPPLGDWERFHRAVEHSLADPRIDPERLARNLGMSPRALHALAAQHRTTVMGHVRERRVERAKLLLAHASVAEVAERCGFSSATLFGRVFRDLVGAPPSVFARTHALLGARPPSTRIPPFHTSSEM